MTKLDIDIPVKGKYIITGSAVLNLRLIKDIDVICASKDITIPTEGDEFIRTATYKGKKFEFLLIDNQKSLREIMDHTHILKPEDIYYILKAGHIHVAGRNQEAWEKHIYDYHILRKLVKTTSYIDYLVKLHKATTNSRIKQKTPKLKGVTVDKFFDDYVEKYFVHDDIHKLVAYREKPGYSYMQRNDGTVECLEGLWNTFSFKEKLQTAAEETYVIALERHIIPGIVEKKVAKPRFLAYKWALWRVCTNLTSGWFRQFAIDNYFDLLNMYDDGRIAYVLNKLNVYGKQLPTDKETATVS